MADPVRRGTVRTGWLRLGRNGAERKERVMSTYRFRLGTRVSGVTPDVVTSQVGQDQYPTADAGRHSEMMTAHERGI